MPYNFNIPQATDQISVSQGQILINFQSLGAIAGNANPNTFSLNAGTGFNYVYFTAGNSPPVGTAFGANNALFSSNVAFNGGTAQNEIFVNKQNQATQVQIPMTASILDTTSAPVINTNGWTMLPSGILIKWGYATAGTAAWGLGLNTVNYPTTAGIPPFTGVPFNLSVTLAKQDGNSVADVNTAIASNLIDGVSFRLDIRTRDSTIGVAQLLNLSIYWIAIGRGV
jgi:hypothetical protein